MAVEVLADANGTILALNTAHEGQKSARRSAREPRGEKSGTLWPPTIGMQPRAGQQRHAVTRPAELEGMPLKEIHSLFVLCSMSPAHDWNASQAERAPAKVLPFADVEAVGDDRPMRQGHALWHRGRA
jgi:hypothetical protein